VIQVGLYASPTFTSHYGEQQRKIHREGKPTVTTYITSNAFLRAWGAVFMPFLSFTHLYSPKIASKET